MKTIRPLLGVLSLTLVLLNACAAAGSPAPSVDASPSGGGSGSSSGAGAVPSFGPIADGQPTTVVPQPGTLNAHDVGATGIAAAVDGRRLFVRLVWWSGVEPCNVLDSIVLARDGTNLQLTLREGSTDLNAACIEIAQLKSTIVDLGEMERGTYTISAYGDVDPVTVEVK